MSGRPWAPAVRPLSIARTQCSKSVPSSADTRGWPYASCASGASSGASRNGTRSSSTPDVAGRADILRHHVRQPQQIVGAARAQAAAARLVPPVLDVAFDELPAGGAEQMRSGEVGPRQQQRHHVLQLIAKAEGAARLVVARARPETAAHVLIDEPPVDQHVERIVRRADLDRLERPVPGCLRPVCSAATASSTVRVTRDQPLDVIGVRALAQQEQDPATLSRIQDDLHVQRRAGIQPGAELRLERHVAQRRRPGHRTVAADERETVAGRGTRRLAGVRERDAPRELVAVGVAREDRPARRVVGRGDLPGLTLPRRAEHPVVVGEDAQRPRRPSPSLVSVSSENFTGSSTSTNTSSSWRMPRVDAREARDAGRMTDDELPARRRAASSVPASATTRLPSRRRE